MQLYLVDQFGISIFVLLILVDQYWQTHPDRKKISIITI